MKRFRSRKGAPGIVEIAARAGVSTATVSRAFNQPDSVKEPTRLKIEEAARDFGYIRDREAGTLDNRFSGTIGLIVPTIDNAIFAEMIDAFSRQLNEHDRTMLIAAHGYDLSLEVAIVRSLLKQRIDGVVLVGLDHKESPLTMLEQRNIPTITIWNYSEESPVPCIGMDNRAAAATVTDHVLGLGHRDIAFIFPDVSGNDRARDRMKGALDRTAEAGLSTPASRIHSCPYDIGEAKELAKSILAENAPTAFVCGNDIIAHGVIFACQSLGVKVPEDVSVVAIGDFRGSEHMEPGLTTIRLPARRIGRLAADAIVNMSKTGKAPEPYRQLIDFTFVRRASSSRIS